MFLTKLASIGKNQHRPFSHISEICDLDLDLGHTAYCRVSLTDLQLHTKLHSN